MAASTKKTATNKAAGKKTAPKPRPTPKPGPPRAAKAKAPARPSRSGAAPRRSSAARRPPSRAVVARNAQKLASERVAEMVPADAVALLEQDHREAEAFFAQFEQDRERQPALARKI